MHIKNAQSLTHATKVLGALSFVTTALGILNLMRDADSLIVAAPMAFVLSAVIQSLILFGARLVGRPGSVRVFFGALAVWGISATISTLFSAAFYFDLLASRDFVRDEIGAVGNKLGQAAASRQAAMERRHKALSELASSARAWADTEEVGSGGTCPKLPKGRGKGPAYAKRTWEAARYDMLAANFQTALAAFRELSVEIAEFQGKLGKAMVADSAELRSLREKVRAFRQQLEDKYSPTRSANEDEKIESYLSFEKKGFPEDPEYAGFSGPNRACGDDKTIAALRSVLDAKLPPLPDDVPLVGDPKDPSYAIKKIYSAGLVALGLAKPNGKAAVELFSADYALPLALGVLVDAWILIISVLIGFLGRAHARSNAARMYAIVESVGPSFEAIDPATALERRPEDFLDGHAGVIRAEYERITSLGLIPYRDRLYIAVPHVTAEEPSKEDRPVFDFLKQLKRALEEEGLILGLEKNEGIRSKVVRGLGLLGLKSHDHGSADVYEVHGRAEHLGKGFDRSAGFEVVARVAAEKTGTSSALRSDLILQLMRERTSLKAAYVLAAAETKDGELWTVKLDPWDPLAMWLVSWQKIHEPGVRTVTAEGSKAEGKLSFEFDKITYLELRKWLASPGPDVPGDGADTIVDVRPRNGVAHGLPSWADGVTT